MQTRFSAAGQLGSGDGCTSYIASILATLFSHARLGNNLGIVLPDEPSSSSSTHHEP